MNSTALRLLHYVVGGTFDSQDLMKLLKIKRWQFNEHIKKLTQENYIKKNGNTITLQDNAKARLLQSISRRLDIQRLLRDSNEQLFVLVTEPITINQLCINTGLSFSTVYKAISDFKSIGVLARKPALDDSLKSRVSDKVQLSSKDTDLVTFARILKTEQDSRYESDAEIIFKNDSIILKKILSGKITKGQTTAYTLFSDYGVRYNSPFDYYVEQKPPLDIHDILMHAVVAAYKDQNKLSLTVAIVFYVRNKSKFDSIRLRELACFFEITTVWLDIEGYLQRHDLKNPKLFLPWQEFVLKAELYNIPTSLYVLPKSYPKLFDYIEKNLVEDMTIYVIGGENMRIKNLKGTTQDCDIIVENLLDFEKLKYVLSAKLNYSKIPIEEFSTEDLRLSPNDIFEHISSSRIDLFAKKIMRTVSLSSTMISRIDVIDYGKLKVGLLCNEDVFLFKAIASRQGDIQDMASLVQNSTSQPSKYQHGLFDWQIVWDELLLQERINQIHDFTIHVFQQLNYIDEQTNITPPFLDELKRHVLDRLIQKQLRGGVQSLNHIAELLSDSDISEKMIRNRIDSLVRNNTLTKKHDGNVYLELAQLPVFPEPAWEINIENLKTYLYWRFPTRTEAASISLVLIVYKLLESGYETIGEIDDIVIQTLAVASRCEQDHSPRFGFSTVEFTKICVKLSNASLENINVYQVSDLEKYRKMLKQN